jgi:hypothetical protein
MIKSWTNLSPGIGATLLMEQSVTWDGHALTVGLMLMGGAE